MLNQMSIYFYFPTESIITVSKFGRYPIVFRISSLFKVYFYKSYFAKAYIISFLAYIISLDLFLAYKRIYEIYSYILSAKKFDYFCT